MAAIEHKQYRKELDGLRALAVISVIIYHAELSWRGFSLLPGGFLGVDIFFVLSGFLITGILIEKQPTLFKFYKHRIDRIYPALLLLLLMTCFAAYRILQPSDLLSFAKTLIGALGFYSNYVFMNEEAYVADASKYKALLHTWSLGVEWQYYLLFPFIIYGIKRFLSSQFEQIIILLSAASFFYCLYLLQMDSSQAFYSTPVRIWQLFMGGLVFLIYRKIKNNPYSSYLSAFGLVIIFYSLLFFKDTDNHLGFISFPVVLGTALFILFTKSGDFVYKIATLRVSSFIGLLSYSLYLYHQPILVFYRLNFSEVGKKDFLILLPIMIGIAYLSYRFFEQPMRRSKNNQKYILIFILIALIFSFANSAKNTGGYPERQPEKVKNALAYFEKDEFRRLSLAPAGLDFAGNERLECNMRMPSTACRIDDRKLDLMIAGDSFAGVFLYSFYELRDKINFATYDYEECPLLLDPIWFGYHPECWEINKERWKVLESSEPTNMLIGTKFWYFYNDGKKSIDVFSKGMANLQDRVSSEFIYSSFRKSISKLVALGHNIIILLHTPQPNIDVNEEMKRRISSGIWHFDDEYLGTSTYRMDMDVKKALAGIEGIKFIDMNKRMCNGVGKCLVFNRDGGLYNGMDHLSYYGAQLFMSDILALMK